MLGTGVNHSSLTEVELNSVETIYRAFNTKDVSLFDVCFHRDWITVPHRPGTQEGPAGIKQIATDFFHAFPDLRVIIHEILGAKGRAAVRASFTGTHLGPILGVAPTGEKVYLACHDFHHLEDGMIVHTWHLEDWFAFLNQTGVWPL